jgi:hypothetical protein
MKPKATIEEFIKNKDRENVSFAIQVDDLIRRFVEVGEEDEELHLVSIRAPNRRIGHIVCDYYGLEHITYKPDLEALRKEHGSLDWLSYNELDKMGLTKFAPNGCIPDCCGYTVVANKGKLVVRNPSRKTLEGKDSMRKLCGRKPLMRAKAKVPDDSSDEDEEGKKEAAVREALPQLPRDVICHIFSYLSNLEDQFCGLLVCKHFEAALNASSLFWKEAYTREIERRWEQQKEKPLYNVKQADLAHQKSLPHTIKEGTASFWKVECMQLRKLYCLDKACFIGPKHRHLKSISRK